MLEIITENLKIVLYIFTFKVINALNVTINNVILFVIYLRFLRLPIFPGLALLPARRRCGILIRRTRSSPAETARTLSLRPPAHCSRALGSPDSRLRPPRGPGARAHAQDSSRARRKARGRGCSSPSSHRASRGPVAPAAPVARGRSSSWRLRGMT